jgi:hypothetical protein
MKAQGIRLLDVFFIGPVMIRAGLKGRNDVLTVLGILTILYNGANYLKLRGVME